MARAGLRYEVRLLLVPFSVLNNKVHRLFTEIARESIILFMKEKPNGEDVNV